jgi:radical SAM protein with 4Fe4S-binding SPASM domain
MNENNIDSREASEFRDPFLEHRKAQEQAHLARIANSEDPMHSLVSVEFNITELCNRVCVFCPRVNPDVYPNQNLNMPVSIVKKVAEDLRTIKSKSRISFSGFGEALLHNGFEEILRTIRSILPENPLEVNTNGDRLDIAKIDSLYAAGLTNLYVNMYDGPEQIEYFTEMFAKSSAQAGRWKLRAHWEGAMEDYGLTLNNRSGMVVSPELGLLPLEEALDRPCFYPFYKMLVDWDGQVIFCSNDWGREIRVGNVENRSISELWLSPEMAEIRKRLMRGDRSIAPCNRCNVHGTLHGGSSYDRIIAHYEKTGFVKPGEAMTASEINK